MITLRDKIKFLRKKDGVSWELIQQDYLLSWVLAGIIAVPELNRLIVFKGGTAIKKNFIGDYRYSQDLDFSTRAALPDDNTLEKLMVEACKKAVKLQSIYKEPLIITCKWYTETKPHPENQKAFVIQAQFPWQREPLTTVMVEISTQEPVLLTPAEKTIIHSYDEKIEGAILTYQLEEIVAEKIRAILQFAKKLHERGWGRSRVRDYYDLWRILSMYNNRLSLDSIPNLVVQKCSLKNVYFTGPSQLFTNELLDDLDESWERWLAPFVPNLPRQEIVITELQKLLNQIWENHS